MKFESFGDSLEVNFEIVPIESDKSSPTMHELKVRLRVCFDLISKKTETISGHIDPRIVIPIERKTEFD